MLDKDDLKVTLTDEGDMLPLKLSMRPSNGKGDLSYNLSPASIENPDQDPARAFTSPDEKMFIERSRKGLDGKSLLTHSPSTTNT